MFEVFFGDKIVIFVCNGDTTVGDRPEAEVCDLSPGGRIGITKMLEKLENNNIVVVKAPDAEAALADFASQFVQVEAAGGVVRDGEGRLLMIYRNDRWDLPKGHVEAGETMREAAVREVAEETGVDASGCGELMTATCHFYRMYGRWEFKRTYWFPMEGSGATEPQQEEGIARVEWVPRDMVAAYGSTAFMSVRRVLAAAGYGVQPPAGEEI